MKIKETVPGQFIVQQGWKQLALKFTGGDLSYRCYTSFRDFPFGQVAGGTPNSKGVINSRTPTSLGALTQIFLCPFAHSGEKHMEFSPAGLAGWSSSLGKAATGAHVVRSGVDTS